MGFTYTTITPPNSTTRASLLEFDGVRILADPGWDTQSDIAYLDSIIPTVDLILLSHPMVAFMGAFGHLAMKNKRGLNIPVYATLPTINLGRVATIDAYRTLGLIGPVQNSQFELSELENAFDSINPIKHSQTLDLRGKFDGLTITALNAGHTLGGTIWLLTKNSEKITYAPEFNQARDSFLNGADLSNPLLQRSSVVITGSKLGSAKPHKKRVEQFLDLVSQTLTNGGTVFLPTSIGSRLLELIHLIDNHLQSAPIPVLLLSHSKARSLTYAGSMQEWMSSAVMKTWETKVKIPFDASKVEVIEPMELMNRQGAKVVFASGAAFEEGSLAQQALMLLCHDQNTTVFLTERPNEGTIGYELYKSWNEKTIQAGKSLEDGLPVGFEQQIGLLAVREDTLKGDELSEYQDKIKSRREAIEEAKKASQTNANNPTSSSKLEDESESESEDEDPIASANNTTNNSKAQETTPIDVDVRQLKNRSKMFPFTPKRVKNDDYGQVINPQQFVRLEEKPNFQLKHKQPFQRKKAVQLGGGGGGGADKKKWNEGKKQDDTSHLDSLKDPVKITSMAVEIKAKCVLAYIDLEGIADFRSTLGLLTSIKPRNIILLRDFSDSENITKLATGLLKIGKFEVAKAEDNEPVEPRNTVQSFDLLLDEELANGLKWQRIGNGYNVAHVIGAVKDSKEYKQLLQSRKAQKEKETGVKSEEMDVDSDGDEDDESSTGKKTQLHLTPLPANLQSNTSLQTLPLAIGDIKLPELRKMLTDLDHKVEFKGEGTLVVDDCCVVRKLGDGEVVVDGVPGAVVYEVRGVVRGMLAYV